MNRAEKNDFSNFGLLRHSRFVKKSRACEIAQRAQAVCGFGEPLLVRRRLGV
jgi:hypothetical protein